MSDTFPPFGTMETARFHLRPLTLDDVTPTYQNWFAAPEAAHLSASANQTMDSLRAFVAEKTSSPNILFLGVFDKESGAHIGNIKYEPIDQQAHEAVMGIFIGDTSRLGQGIGPEVIRASAAWLHTHCDIHRIVLGVARDNLRAIRSYEKIGFVPTPSARIPDLDYVISMIWDMG